MRASSEENQPSDWELEPATRQRGIAATLTAVAKDSGLSIYEIAKRSGHDQSGLNKFYNVGMDNLRIDVTDDLFRLFQLKVVSVADQAYRPERMLMV